MLLNLLIYSLNVLKQNEFNKPIYLYSDVEILYMADLSVTHRQPVSYP